MNQKDACLLALDRAKLFENSGHRTRFKELMDCYSHFPFFTNGLCKCMYLLSLIHISEPTRLLLYYAGSSDRFKSRQRDNHGRYA